MKQLIFCTISKFPPYMSGHSFEAIYQGKALYEITGRKHYEVTYHPDLYDKSTNYNDSPDLLEEAHKYINVHQVKPNGTANIKVFDGALVKAFIGDVINLIEKNDVNVLSTYYLDPHAYIANQARDYAREVLGKEVLVTHKALGSDVLNSMANHLDDGEAKFLLLQFLQSDIMLAASQYTKDKVLEYAETILPAQIVEKLSKETLIHYAPMDNEFFNTRDENEIDKLKEKLHINKDHKILSYFGRVFPEKGIEDLITAFDTIKKQFPDTSLVIGGYGYMIEPLREQAIKQGTPDIFFTGAVGNAEKRAVMQMSYCGVIPTKPIANFVETLCVCALEYQASGTPLITTPVGGVPEAGGPHSIYAKHSDPTDLTEKIVNMLTNKYNREEMIKKGLEHTSKFNYMYISKEYYNMVQDKYQGLTSPQIHDITKFTFKKSR